MAVNDDLQYFYSGTGVAAGSLGGAIHANQIVTSQDENLFSNIGTTEATAGSDKYRCIYIKNNGVVTYNGVGIYLESITPSEGTKIFLGNGTSAVNAAEQSIADEDTEPVGVIWSHKAFSFDALTLATLAPNDTKAFWMKRQTLVNTQGLIFDYFRLKAVSL